MQRIILSHRGPASTGRNLYLYIRLGPRGMGENHILTARVTGDGMGVDNTWEQGKLEARKMPENAARREAAVPPVR